MPRANGPECGTKAKSACDAGGRLRERGDLRRMPVRERVVRVQVAVTLRMMRARDRLAAGAGAAGDAGHEQPRLDEAERQQRHAREQHGRREAARVRDVRRRAARSGARAPRR